MTNKIIAIDDTIQPKTQYKGSVKVLYIDKNSGRTKILRKHNSGGPGLFTSICRMLVGLNVQDYVPSYIYGYEGNNGAGLQLFAQRITYASTPVLYQTSKPKGSDDPVETLAVDATVADIVQYTFMVPTTCIKHKGRSIKSLILYNNRDEVCATINFPDSDAIDTSVSSNILIYWKLKFE